jgi:cyanophycinase
MDEVDTYLLAHASANGRKPRVACLPTAAGREGQASVDRWSSMAIEHFQRLNADVQALPITDKASANDLQWASTLEQADLIYFSGGDPYHLYQTMQGTRAWEAAQKAWARGAVYAGCSAGAMILGGQIPDIRAAGLRSIPAFGVIPARFIIPHFDAIPGLWKPIIFALRRRLKEGETMLGIDENTALVGKLRGKWQVMGQSKVHVFRRDGSLSCAAGETLAIDD